MKVNIASQLVLSNHIVTHAEKEVLLVKVCRITLIILLAAFTENSVIHSHNYIGVSFQKQH